MKWRIFAICLHLSRVYHSFVHWILARLIIELSFKLTFWTRIEIELNCSHFQLDSSRVAHIFNLMQLDLTENWVNLTWLIKNSSLMSRELNIENFSIFDFCIIFLHYLLIESHKEKHEDCLIKSHKKKHEDRLIESHKKKHEDHLIESHKEKHEDHLIESHKEKHEDRLIESHKEKHEDHLIKSHDEKHEEKHEEEHEESHDEKHKKEHEEKHEEKTWRSFDFDRKSWRENMIESHEENHENCSIKLFTSI